MGRKDKEPDLTVAQLLKTKVRKIILCKLNFPYQGTAMQGVVVLDPTERTPLARVLLHELIHVQRPMFSEARTLKEERRLWRNATWREKAELYRMFRHAKVWEGEQAFDDIDVTVLEGGENDPNGLPDPDGGKIPNS